MELSFLTPYFCQVNALRHVYVTARLRYGTFTREPITQSHVTVGFGNVWITSTFSRAVLNYRQGHYRHVDGIIGMSSSQNPCASSTEFAHDSVAKLNVIVVSRCWRSKRFK